MNIRLPLCNMPAEQSVLGTLLVDMELYKKVEFLEPDHFADPIHGLIFDLSCSEPIVLYEEPDFLDEVGGPQYLETLKTYADPERLLENALEIYACWKKRDAVTGDHSDAVAHLMITEDISLSEAMARISGDEDGDNL
jgi:hypothetical protein